MISHQVIHCVELMLCLVLEKLIEYSQIFGSAVMLQAVLRALYAYFADRPLKEIPHIEVVTEQL